MLSILVDFNNVKMSRLFCKDVMEKTKYTVHNIDYDIWKYAVFESIYNYVVKFSPDEVVIATDSKISWRKLLFPLYKANRPEQRQKYNINWDRYQEISDSFTKELKEHFPFKFIELKYAEADDIIGSITLNSNDDHKIIIVSSDNDYLQLTKNGIQLYSIMKQDYISHPNPDMWLKEYILRGQPKDNIFNVATPLDYPKELRKPPLGEKGAEKMLIQGLDEALNKYVSYTKKYHDENGKGQLYKSTVNLQERYNFNKNLIDFNKIPKSISKKILKIYKNYEYPHPNQILVFLQKYGWPTFIDNITNVENRLFNLYKSDKNG